jgi:predicted Fe-S protein YdhL (DUF1289 family)
VHCDHVYKNTGTDICSSCGRDTHEIDWALLRKQRKAYREEHGLFYTTNEWWSI